MSDEDEFRRVTEIERATTGKPSYFAMDAAFCARMHAAIEAGLESAPISIITQHHHAWNQKPEIRLGPNCAISSLAQRVVTKP